MKYAIIIRELTKSASDDCLFINNFDQKLFLMEYKGHYNVHFMFLFIQCAPEKEYNAKLYFLK